MTIPIFSIVIPVYNRAWSVRRAIESAILFSDGGIPIEIILVDDASTDNSVEVIENLINKNRNLPNISFQFIRHLINKGVCGAKNSGANAASGTWIVFLDSDDELISNTAENVYKTLKVNEKYPLHFFKCNGENDLLVDKANNSFELRDFNTYLRKGTNGESLPIVRRNVFIKNLYDEDLNGYESLSYLRIIRVHSFAVINSLVVRRYYTSHEDRLSSKAGMKRRYQDLAIGHLRIIKEHWVIISIPMLIKQYVRYLKSIVLLKLA